MPSWPSSGQGSNPITVNGRTTDVARQPTHEIGAVNTHASVVFRLAASQYFLAGTMPGGAEAMLITMYAVAKILGSGTVLTGFGTPYLSIRGATYDRIETGAGNSTIELNSVGTVDAAGPFADGGFHIVIVVHKGANFAIYVDGRDPVTGNRGVPDIIARLTGEIAEAGLCARAPTANDAHTIAAILKSKRAIAF